MRWPTGIFYGWYIVAVAALLVAVADWPQSNGLWVWNSVLRNSFGWTAVQLSGAHFLIEVALLMAPVPGILVDRMGPRRAAFFGLLVLSIGFVLFSQVRELWHLYLVFMVIAIGSLMSSLLPMMTVVNNWFSRRKTTAMAALALGGVLSSIIVPVLLVWAIGDAGLYESERRGWRATTLFIGLAYLALAFPLYRLVRNMPEDMGLLPDGDALPPDARVQAASGGYTTPDAGWEYSWREAVRTKDFWLMAIGNAAGLETSIAILVHLGLFLDDRGYPLSMEGLTVAVIVATGAVFLLVGGFLGDKFSMRKLAFAFSALLALSVVLLVLASGTGMLLAFAVLFGMGSGGPISIMFSMRGRYFGRKAFATITGISISLMSISGTVGPMVAGAVRDSMGDYNAVFLALAAVTLVGGLAFLMMGEPPRRPRTFAGDGPLEQEPSEMANP